ncbi:endonuclease I family protein [Bacillus timonensis]|uniref:endonuclease I family protein n=1 Tax=Bacillus timonensis TaxID=1033734 RepID=UPI0002885AA7|nr:endonuclease [Bacillus timonensis]
MEILQGEVTNERTDLKAVLLEVKEIKKRFENEKEYYDEEVDKQNITEYYQNIDFTQSDKKELYNQINQLLTNTHKHQLPYNSKTRNILYSRVDLQMNGKLKSIYSGKDREPEQVIQEDYEADRKRIESYDLLQKNETKTEFDLQMAVATIKKENMFNCEHVVPQSWFNEDNPMKGDLHHLFTCEKDCNSTRSNYPYYDFDDYLPIIESGSIKVNCGKYEEGKFEPESGKGEVARATLYFLLRYPGEINQYNKKDIEMMLEWHHAHKVSIYEKHRNKEIFLIQKNRNPLIDYPQLVNNIDFASGLSQ